MAKLVGASGLERGRELLRLYGAEEPDTPLRTVAMAMNAVQRMPECAALGPAMRNLRRADDDPFGAVITDIRDFLKLRFRARGLGDLSVEGLQSWIASDGWPSEVDATAKSWHEQGDLVAESAIVNYVISALDALAEHTEAFDAQAVLARLRDLLLVAEGSLYFIWHGNVVIFGKTHEEIVESMMKHNDENAGRPF